MYEAWKYPSLLALHLYHYGDRFLLSAWFAQGKDSFNNSHTISLPTWNTKMGRNLVIDMTRLDPLGHDLPLAFDVVLGPPWTSHKYESNVTTSGISMQKEVRSFVLLFDC